MGNWIILSTADAIPAMTGALLGGFFAAIRAAYAVANSLFSTAVGLMDPYWERKVPHLARKSPCRKATAIYIDRKGRKN